MSLLKCVVLFVLISCTKDLSKFRKLENTAYNNFSEYKSEELKIIKEGGYKRVDHHQGGFMVRSYLGSQGSYHMIFHKNLANRKLYIYKKGDFNIDKKLNAELEDTLLIFLNPDAKQLTKNINSLLKYDKKNVLRHLDNIYYNTENLRIKRQVYSLLYCMFDLDRSKIELDMPLLPCPYPQFIIKKPLHYPYLNIDENLVLFPATYIGGKSPEEYSEWLIGLLYCAGKYRVTRYLSDASLDAVTMEKYLKESGIDFDSKNNFNITEDGVRRYLIRYFDSK